MKNSVKFLNVGEVEQEGIFKSPMQMVGSVVSNAVKDSCSMFRKCESEEPGDLYTLSSCIFFWVFCSMKEACKSSIPCSMYV